MKFGKSHQVNLILVGFIPLKPQCGGGAHVGLLKRSCKVPKATMAGNRQRFFEQVGHETMFVSSGNKHFFTKSCQSYEQPPQTSQNSDFQSHFSVSKIGQIFPFFSLENIGLGDQLLLKNVLEKFDFQNTLFSKNVPNFCQLCS